MPQKSQKTILVVDDEADIRQIISRLVQSLGHRPVCAENGKEALHVIGSATAVDLLILDVMMPEMDGYETLSLLRKQWKADLPVIMLTAKASGSDVMKGYREGADYYITKPFKNQTLANIVEYLIGDLTDAQKEKLESTL